jgi:hypothetical protein
MEIRVDYTYLDAMITVGKDVMEEWADGNKDYVLECLAHELSHLLTGYITCNKGTARQSEREETVTTHIGRLLLRLYRGKR